MMCYNTHNNPSVLIVWCGCVFQELSSCGHTASLIPVLSFRFVSLDELSERVSLEPASGASCSIVSIRTDQILKMRRSKDPEFGLDHKTQSWF